MILRLLLAIFSVALLLGCYNGTDDKGESQEVKISHLLSLCQDRNYLVVEPLKLRCVVVANDSYGELYKSIIVADDTGTLQINIDVRDYNESFPLYTEFDIVCNGLTLSRVGGRIEMGISPTGEYPLTNISEDDLSSYFHNRGTKRDYQPVTTSLSDFSKCNVGAIVHIEGVRIEEAENGLFWCDFVDGEAQTTFRTLVDEAGATLPLRTIPTCVYASDPLPQNEISVTGMVDYSDDRHFLRILNKWITQ